MFVDAGEESLIFKIDRVLGSLSNALENLICVAGRAFMYRFFKFGGTYMVKSKRMQAFDDEPSLGVVTV